MSADIPHPFDPLTLDETNLARQILLDTQGKDSREQLPWRIIRLCLQICPNSRTNPNISIKLTSL